MEHTLMVELPPKPKCLEDLIPYLQKHGLLVLRDAEGELDQVYDSVQDRMIIAVHNPTTHLTFSVSSLGDIRENARMAVLACSQEYTTFLATALTTMTHMSRGLCRRYGKLPDDGATRLGTKGSDSLIADKVFGATFIRKLYSGTYLRDGYPAVAQDRTTGEILIYGRNLHEFTMFLMGVYVTEDDTKPLKSAASRRDRTPGFKEEDVIRRLRGRHIPYLRRNRTYNLREDLWA